MKKKLFVAILLMTIVVMACASAMAECAHTNYHYEALYPEYDATCTDPGIGNKICNSCGQTIAARVTIPPKGHKGSWTLVQTGTCIQPEIEQRTCTVCGETETRQDNSTLNVSHDYSAIGQTLLENTCKTDGKALKICKWCKEITPNQETVVIPASPYAHKWEQTGYKPAMCGNVSETYYKCTVCGETKTDYGPSGGAWHTAEKQRKNPVKDATCEEPGSYQILCDNCDYVMETVEIPQLQHDWSEWVRMTEPTCQEAGTLVRTCNYNCGKFEERPITVIACNSDKRVDIAAADCCNAGSYELHCSMCDKKTGGDAIPPTGHNAAGATKEDLKEATCGADGYYKVLCAKYGTILSEKTLTATGKHDFSVLKSTTAPTCEKDGIEVYQCTGCGQTRPKTIPTPGHTPKTTEKKPTCTEWGGSVTVCTVCGGTLGGSSPSNQPPLGHDFSVLKSTTAPTCEAGGVEVYQCSRCDETTPKTLAPLDHKPKVNKTAATCTTAGSSVTVCENCGKTLAGSSPDNEPALGHDWSAWTQTKAPTETAEGEETRTCKREGCGAKETQKVDMLTPKPTEAPTPAPVCEHDRRYQVRKEPTCEKPGRTDGYKCIKCGEEFEGLKTLRALGHDWGEWVTVVEPTTESAGTAERECKREGCDATETDILPKVTEAPGPATPVPTEPAPTEPVPTEPVPTEPVPTEPVPTEPVPTEPVPTEPVPTEPVPTEPVPTEPVPTEPVPTEPVPTEPVPTEPVPTEPVPTADPYVDPDHVHTEVTLKGYPPTCEEPGRGDSIICGDCKEVLQPGEVIPATGHQNIKVIPEIPATPDAPGKTAGLYCEDCGKVLKNPQTVDYEGNIIGGDDDDDKDDVINGTVIDPTTGEEIGKVDDNVYTDNDGNVIGTFQPDGSLVDPNGNVIGKVEDDRIYDNDGNHVGTIIDPIGNVNGTVIDPATGNEIGKVEDNVYTDANGNVIGTFQPDGSLVDPNGNVIGKLEGNYIYDNNGNHIGTIIDGTLIPGHPDFDLDKYLDEFYKHVEDGEKIRPTIESDRCIIGETVELDKFGVTTLIKGAEDYSICPVDKYPMSQWIPLGDGKHVRVCTCLDCDYSEIGVCDYFEITVDEVLHKICPICGHFGAEQYEHVMGVKVGEDGHLHEMMVRDYTEPFGAADCLVKDYSEETVKIAYSFTAVKSSKGLLNTWPETDVETLHVPMPNPGDVTLVRMDKQGEFSVVPFQYSDGMVSFNADRHGLYLIVTK